MNKPQADAALLKNPFSAQLMLGTYLRFHSQALLASGRLLLRTPLTSVLTIVAMGISLALPTALDVFVKQISSWRGGIQRSAELTLFLHKDVGDVRAQQITQRLRQWPEVAEIQYISPLEALEEFRQTTGIDEVIDILEQNPLPAQIRVTPKIGLTQRVEVQKLLAKLQTLTEVDLAELDMQWLQRLDIIIELSWRLLLLLGFLFGLAVLVIAANSTRLAINSQSNNIQVAKLVGATSAYIRRPFLYSGVWFGLSSGLVAWISVLGGLWSLQTPANALAQMYSQDLSLLNYGLDAGKIIPIACLLGWIGARVGSGRFINKLDPV